MNDPFSTHIAAAYNRHAGPYAALLEPYLKPMAGEILRRGGPVAGERVLDLATGTGLIARLAAQAGSAVAGVDLSPGMLAAARSLSRGRIPLAAGDTQLMPFQDDCFDLVTCGISLSHFPDVSIALKEILRVLRPEGRFVASAWGRGGETPTKAAAVRVRDKFLEDWERTFQGSLREDFWADSAQGCQVLRRAGFSQVQAASQFITGEYRDADQAVEVALVWPLTRYRIARLDPEEQQKLREKTAAAIRQVDDLSWKSEIIYYQAIRPG